MQEKRNRQAYRLAIKHYWQEALRSKRTVVPGLLLTGLGSILVFYVPPLLVAKLLGRYQDGDIPALSELIPFLLMFGGLWMLGEIIWRIALFFMIRSEIASVKRLSINAVTYLLDKDLSFFHDNFAGSLTKKTNGYSMRYIDIMDTMMFNIAPFVIPLFFISYVLWQFSPWLVLGLLGWTSFTILLVFPLIKRRRRLVAIREEAHNKVSGHIADLYANVDAVRAFAHEEHEKAQHEKNVGDLAKKMERSWRYQNERVDVLISPMYVLTNVFGLALSLHIARTTGVGIEVVFVTFNYFTNVTRFMWEFNSIYRRLETGLSDAAQFTELLLDEPKLVDVANPRSFAAPNGQIVFKDVDFRYHDNKHQELFDKLNLEIKAGERIGLVGHSGGGKTTLTKLLLRFMEIDGGSIEIDGHDISQVRQSDLRHQIAYVPQEPYLFHRSIADNIRYGKLDATDEEVRHAAKLSHCAEFIEQLPDGYETLIGERGVKLSGGQRQRVAIARAMIKNAPILVLDEATSALDSESEVLIQKALWELMKGRTAIVIAHRLSTIQRMDRIIVLDEGKIAEQGSHKELLAKNGIYAQLWSHQSGGFIEE